MMTYIRADTSLNGYFILHHWINVSIDHLGYVQIIICELHSISYVVPEGCIPRNCLIAMI